MTGWNPVSYSELVRRENKVGYIKPMTVAEAKALDPTHADWADRVPKDATMFILATFEGVLILLTDEISNAFEKAMKDNITLVSLN